MPSQVPPTIDALDRERWLNVRPSGEDVTGLYLPMDHANYSSPTRYIDTNMGGDGPPLTRVHFILLSIFVRALLTAGSLKNLTEHPATQGYRCAHPAPAVGGGSGQYFHTAPGPSQFEHNSQVGRVRAPSPLLCMYSQVN